MDPYKFALLVPDRPALERGPSSAFNSPFWTTNSGAPVWNNNSSLTVGARAFFTKPGGAKPETKQHFFGRSSSSGRLPFGTPPIVRFSTVIHERGSPETLRDPRGFAVKFYTREGNFDLVGNNFPVFFIRDGMKFPDMVHALKPNPKSHIQENWRILDFFSHHPESLHMFTFLFDDIGIPQDYRHMDGSGVHTYTLIDKAGKAHYVKFHWKPTCGVKNLLEDEAITVGGANHSHATQDLYDSIAAGNYPEWKVFIQVMDPADEDRFDFDPLDVTKTWPEDILPLQPVGQMVLSKNIDNFFAENEQLAFCPSIIVPANAPKCVHHNNHHEGFMNFMHRDEEVNYFPSRFDPARHAEKYPIPTAICSGKRDKIWFLCVWADKSLGQKLASRLGVRPSY
ncbi:hypothetical protein GOBAR_DD16804 [Gossypium barbadense]|nr:hypothetical protein GOBAR_DD16804 [Gossypium barbadense]